MRVTSRGDAQWLRRAGASSPRARPLLDRLGPGVDVELGVELAHVGLDRVHRQEQLVADLGAVRLVDRKRSTASSRSFSGSSSVAGAAAVRGLHRRRAGRTGAWRWAPCAVRWDGCSRSRSAHAGQWSANMPTRPSRLGQGERLLGAALGGLGGHRGRGGRARRAASASISKLTWNAGTSPRQCTGATRGERVLRASSSARWRRAARLAPRRRGRRVDERLADGVETRRGRAGRGAATAVRGRASTCGRVQDLDQTLGRRGRRRAASSYCPRPWRASPGRDGGRRWPTAPAPGQDRVGALEPLLALDQHARGRPASQRDPCRRTPMSG